MPASRTLRRSTQVIVSAFQTTTGGQLNDAPAAIEASSEIRERPPNMNHSSRNEAISVRGPINQRYRPSLSRTQCRSHCPSRKVNSPFGDAVTGQLAAMTERNARGLKRGPKHLAKALPHIEQAGAEGLRTYKAVAARLNRRGLNPSRGPQ
jgi:hypothetical protein